MAARTAAALFIFISSLSPSFGFVFGGGGIPNLARLTRASPRASGTHGGLCVARAVAVDQARAASALSDAHADARRRLEGVGFVPTAFASDLGFGDGFQVQIGAQQQATGRTLVGGSVDSFRGLDEQRQTWASALVLKGDGFARYALQAWNGPEIDVPNMFASATASTDGIDLYLDMRPRLDAGYDEDPNMPPTTREGFVRIANRERYDKIYFTQEARAAAAALLSAGNSFSAPTDVVQGRATDRPGSVAGPLLVNARFPLTEESLALCCSALVATVDRYSKWMAEAEPVPWVTTRIVYDRDCQVRLVLYQKAAKDYGVELAAADAGEMGMVGHNRLGLGRGD